MRAMTDEEIEILDGKLARVIAAVKSRVPEEEFRIIDEFRIAGDHELSLESLVFNVHHEKVALDAEHAAPLEELIVAWKIDREWWKRDPAQGTIPS